MSKPETSQADHLTLTPRELRDAFGLFPTGVAVITARTPDGVRLGATVSSFNSVSLDPPLVHFSLGRNANSLAAWEAASTLPSTFSPKTRASSRPSLPGP